MAIGGKFAKPVAKAAGNKQVKKSRYAGIAAAQPRDPIPHCGTYRFRVGACSEHSNPGTGSETFHAQLEIVDLDDEGSKSHKASDSVTILFMLSGPGAPSGLARVKAFVMAAAGFEDEGEYDEFDPSGEYIDACTGAANDYSDKGTITGRVVDCLVTRGNSTKDGTDYYRNFAWAVVPDDDAQQDSVLKAGT